MRAIAKGLAAAAAGATAGCADLGRIGAHPGWDVDAVAARPAPAAPLPAGLREGYLRLARAEIAELDWDDGAQFLAKADAATDGDAPAPFTLADRPVRAEALRIPLAAAEPQMLAVLASPGAVLRAPAEIARMQTDWECWLQEAEEGHQIAEIEACAAAFDASLAAAREAAQLPDQLVVVLPEEDGTIGGVVLSQDDGGELLLDQPFAAGSGAGAVGVLESEVRDIFGGALAARPAPPRRFTVLFDFDSRALDEAAAEIVAAIAEDAAGRPVAEVIVTGHTDAVGGENPNLRLSRGRAVAVRRAVAAALPDQARVRFSTAFRGEADLAVDTRDRERLNRRVEVLVR